MFFHLYLYLAISILEPSVPEVFYAIISLFCLCILSKSQKNLLTDILLHDLFMNRLFLQILWLGLTLFFIKISCRDL